MQNMSAYMPACRNYYNPSTLDSHSLAAKLIRRLRIPKNEVIEVMAIASMRAGGTYEQASGNATTSIT